MGRVNGNKVLNGCVCILMLFVFDVFTSDGTSSTEAANDHVPIKFRFCSSEEVDLVIA